MQNKFLFCVGTRPEAIKLAPLIYLTRHRFGENSCVVVTTGQHNWSILEPIFSFFGVTANIQLTLDRSNNNLSNLNATLLKQVSELLILHKPNIVVVQGDTATALQGAMAGFWAGIPVAHVEAGLRSGNLSQPFPEEANRSLIGRIAKWHFAPTESAAEALLREHVPGEVFVTGNTIVDAVRIALPQLRSPTPSKGKRQLLITMHRRENWERGLELVANTVYQALEQTDDLACCWILHPNPEVAEVVSSVFANLTVSMAERVRLLAPQPYEEMLSLMRESQLLLTDSGGIQEEAVCLGLPILIARDATERPEVLTSGWGRLVGTDSHKILENILSPASWMFNSSGKQAHNPLGDGHASEVILNILVASLMDTEQLTLHTDLPQSAQVPA